MNLIIKPFSLKQLILKVAVYITLFYVLIIAASLAITGYIFLNLEGYRGRIEKTVYKHTGYHLQVGSIQTKLNNAYLPMIVIHDVALINPINSKQSMRVNTLKFVFSYSSIWDLEPIFDQILVDGSDLNIEYDPSGNILINGINVNNPDRQTLENTKNSPIDVEAWVLKQHNIVFDHINLNFLDQKNNLPQITLNNLKIGLERSLWRKHHLYLDIYGKTYQNMLEAELNWQGGKFEDWEKWPSARLKIKSLNGKDNLVTTLQQYLPSILPVSEFNASTAFSAEMKKGQLQNLYANFDVSNFQIALADANLINFPKLGGRLQIKLLNDQYYSVEAKDLMIVTSAGYLFNNAEVTGDYLQNKHGQLALSNTNLMAINNLLSVFPLTDGITIDGMIKIVKFNWNGSFLKPKSYQVFAAFNDISLHSTKPSMPSISHVSGDITIRNNSGHLNVALKNSVLNYDKVFLIPYVFKSLNSQVDWSIAADKQLKVSIHKTDLETKDFKAWLSGSYTTEPKNPDSIGFLELAAHVDRVATSKVGDYLPKSIPLSVHEWLNMGLIGGDGVNANLTFKGELAGFPYRDGKGLFYITADLDRARLRYVKDWPTLDEIRGKFILKNTNITIKADSGLIQGNHLDPTTVIIPDYASNAVYLTAVGKAHGSTANFMEYLKNTPINEIIGKIPEKVSTTGDGEVAINLKVPFKDAHHTEVKGSYKFNNNTLQFAMPVPLLSSVNGVLEFSQKGMSIAGIHADVLGSKTLVSASTGADGRMQFTADAEGLDYQQLAKFYLPAVSNLFTGNAATQIKIELAKHGIASISASSNLLGVSCLAAKPLSKESDQASAMYFNLTPDSMGGYLAKFSYADQLKGKFFIGRDSLPARGQLALGSSEYLSDPDPDSVVTINANTETADIEDWLSTVKKITTALFEAKLDNKESSVTKSLKIETSSIAPKPELIFPMQIQLTSKQIKFGKANFEGGTANLIVDSTRTFFNMYTPIVSGVGDFNYAQDKLKLVLDKYMLFKVPRKISTESTTEISFINGSSKTLKMKLPTIDLTINNLFYQNHNLGKLTAQVNQQGNDLYLESGVLASKNIQMSFSGTNYCVGCGRDASYVDFQLGGQVLNAGAFIYSLDFGNVMDSGKGTVNGALQWNGGFQDFNILQTVGSVNASIDSGKFLEVDPGVVGGLLSIINLQGIWEVGSLDVQSLFKKGFYFNHLDINADILTSQIELKHIYMSGPMAKVNSTGVVNFGNNTVDAYLSVTPKLGVVVALTAGVVTLNPLVGIGVYLAELIIGDQQNKLFTFSYHVSGRLAKPKIERTNVTQQIVKNVNSTVGNSNGASN